MSFSSARIAQERSAKGTIQHGRGIAICSSIVSGMIRLTMPSIVAHAQAAQTRTLHTNSGRVLNGGEPDSLDVPISTPHTLLPRCAGVPTARLRCCKRILCRAQLKEQVGNSACSPQVLGKYLLAHSVSPPRLLMWHHHQGWQGQLACWLQA